MTSMVLSGPDAIKQILNAKIHYVTDFRWLGAYFSTITNAVTSMGQQASKTQGWMGPQYSGVDIETEGVLSPHYGHVATVQIELNGECWVVHIDKDSRLRETPGVELFKAYLENQQVTKIIHNASFELKFFLHEFGMDLTCEPIHDTMAGEYNLAEGGSPSSDDEDTTAEERVSFKRMAIFGLGQTVKRRYGVEMDKDKDLRTGFRRRRTIEVRPPKIAGGHPKCIGCSEDADIFRGGDQIPLCLEHQNHPKVQRMRKIEMIDPDLYTETVVDHTQLSQRQLEYAAFDALWVSLLAQDQIEIMTNREVMENEQYFSIFDLDCRTTEAIARMELHGMPINHDDLLMLDCEFQYEQKMCRERVESELFLLGDTAVVNIGSWQQMVPQLNAYGIPVTSYQTQDLKRFKEYPVIEDLLMYKRISKLQGTYTTGFLKRFCAATCSVHGSFNQFITTTGRLSSSDPNLQNLPSRNELGLKIRELVQAPEGYTFVIADYSQIELRLIAEMFDDEAMQRAFNDGLDLHSMMAAQIMGVSYEYFCEQLAAGNKEYKMARTNAKVCNFGLGYGAGAPKLQVMAWVQYDLDWSMDETRRNKAAFDSTWLGVKAYHQAIGLDIKNGTGPYRVRTQDGRVRVMHRAWQTAKGEPRTCYSAALNHPIQGTSADMIKKVMVALCRDLQFILQVHDELVVMCKIEDAEWQLDLLKTTMEDVGQTYLTKLPIVVEAHISNIWTK